ncbi:MAG: CPBP family intramembrane metalloprotease [Planctomycetes bacterium]|nr:CPBP family intramembrane metalloprotease [Planctomycetota bacterium]
MTRSRGSSSSKARPNAKSPAPRPRALARAEVAIEPEEAELAPSGGASLGYFRESSRASFGIVAVLPLLAAYHVGLVRLDADVRNGADFYLQLGLEAAAPSWSLWVWWGLVAAAVLGAAVHQFRLATPFLRYLLVLCCEAALLGLLLGPLTLLLHEVLVPNSRVLPLGASAPADRAWLDAVLSLGAGVYEEIVFRLLLLSGLYVLLLRGLAHGETGERWRRAKLQAGGLAVLISAVVFSAFHYIGAGADLFVWKEFVYRAIGGGILGIIFILRGFGVVVYTHAAYDLLVFFFFPLVWP